MREKKLSARAPQRGRAKPCNEKSMPPPMLKRAEIYETALALRERPRARALRGMERGRSTHLVQRPSCFFFSAGIEFHISRIEYRIGTPYD
jgi:hypothetical protein